MSKNQVILRIEKISNMDYNRYHTFTKHKPQSAEEYEVEMKEFKYTISDKNGLHARNAMQLSKASETLNSSIWVEKDGRKVNGKNVMELMSLVARQGTSLKFIIEGIDEDHAFAYLTALVHEIL